MTRSLPERTVDIWVVSQLIDIFPGVLLWAPTQRKPDNWDLGAHLGDGKTFILENKACDPVGHTGSHTVNIGRCQLEEYLHTIDPYVPVYYVLPDPPWLDGPTGANWMPNQSGHRSTCGGWLWTIRATDLMAHMTGASTSTFRTDAFSLWAETTSLGNFLSGLKKCEFGELWRRALKERTRQTDQLAHGGRFPGSALGVFVPKSNLDPTPEA